MNHLLNWAVYISQPTDATFAHLAGVDPEDPNTVGTRTDGTKFALPGVDSLNVSARSPAGLRGVGLWPPSRWRDRRAARERSRSSFRG